LEVIVQDQYKISPLIKGDPLFQKAENLVFSTIPECWTYQHLKEMIQDEKQLMQIAFCFRINPTPLRKIRSNEPPSRYILNKLQKVEAELSEGADLNDFLFKSPRGRKLISIYRLYQKEGFLEGVGRLMNLSRERVRQLLDKGTKLGLFEYKKFNLKGLADLSKGKIIEDYKKSLSLKEAAHLNGISMYQLFQILHQYKITSRELNAIRNEGRRMYCIIQYILFVNRVGGHPSTTEMEKTADGTSLFSKIIRLWSSIHAFRKELDIRFSSRHKATRLPWSFLTDFVPIKGHLPRKEN
jgi:hypothetical protein